MITQDDFNDLVRDRQLPSRESAEILSLRLKKWDLVDSDLRITVIHDRESFIKLDASFRAMHEDCEKNIDALFETRPHHKPAHSGNCLSIRQPAV